MPINLGYTSQLIIYTVTYRCYCKAIINSEIGKNIISMVKPRFSMVAKQPGILRNDYPASPPKVQYKISELCAYSSKFEHRFSRSKSLCDISCTSVQTTILFATMISVTFLITLCLVPLAYGRPMMYINKTVELSWSQSYDHFVFVEQYPAGVCHYYNAKVIKCLCIPVQCFYYLCSVSLWDIFLLCRGLAMTVITLLMLPHGPFMDYGENLYTWYPKHFQIQIHVCT